MFLIQELIDESRKGTSEIQIPYQFLTLPEAKIDEN